MVNLRIVVPPLTNRASSLNSVQEEYILTYYLFVCVLILLFVKRCNTISFNMFPAAKYPF